MTGSRARGWLGRLRGDDRMDRRGVTELVGFVLVFSVVVLSVGVVSTVGFEAVTDVQAFEENNNAERAMRTVASNVAGLERGVPARSSEVRLVGGRLSVANATTLTVAVDGPGMSARSYGFAPGSLTFDVNDVAVHYEAGTVVRSGPTGDVVVDEPSFVCTADTAAVAVVTVRRLPGSPGSVSGEGSVTVNARLERTDLAFPDGGTVAGDADSVTVTVGASRSPAGWDRYFSGAGWTGAGPSYTCSADHVLVRETVVTVEVLA